MMGETVKPVTDTELKVFTMQAAVLRRRGEDVTANAIEFVLVPEIMRQRVELAEALAEVDRIRLSRNEWKARHDSLNRQGAAVAQERDEARAELARVRWPADRPCPNPPREPMDEPFPAPMSRVEKAMFALSIFATAAAMGGLATMAILRIRGH